ncbi:hypothetical protein PMI07_001038 [Rhizobium sp. CF080]|nr:hypothetical protein PMI07_001038 [Rhizobium sp. CF080]
MNLAPLVSPSALPGISPSRREIGKLRDLHFSRTARHFLFRGRSSFAGKACVSSISPLEGEMPGRAEGGNASRHRAKRVATC